MPNIYSQIKKKLEESRKLMEGMNPEADAKIKVPPTPAKPSTPSGATGLPEPYDMSPEAIKKRDTYYRSKGWIK